MILTLGILSGLIQLLGYIYYIKKTNREDISPNPTTWLIFAFDTSLLAILEAVSGAKPALLFLPFLCSLGAIYVAWLVRKAGRLTWPTDMIDAYILKVGIFIAFSYTLVFILWNFQIVTGGILLLTGYLFLLLSNLNTFVAFVPILREVYKEPEHEHAGPWTIWTIAYGLLGLITFIEVGSDIDGFIFYIYPVSCFFLHGSVAVLARDKKILNT